MKHIALSHTIFPHENMILKKLTHLTKIDTIKIIFSCMNVNNLVIILTQSEISNLRITMVIKKYVAGLDVPMDNTF